MATPAVLVKPCTSAQRTCKSSSATPVQRISTLGVLSKLEEVRTLVENTCIIIDKLKVIEEYAKVYNLNSHIDCFDTMLSKYDDDSKELRRTVVEAVKGDKYWTFGELNLEAKTIK